MLVSVIVPVYNVQDYLPKCIDSIINQTHKEIELILIDDGSTDSCGDICDRYAAKDKRIKVIHKTNGGLSSARNAGLDAAKGDFIIFVDSDDYIHSEMLETMANKLTDAQADIAICNYYFVDYQGNTIEHDSTIQEEKVLSQDEIMGLLAKGWLPSVISCCKLYRRGIFETLRFPVGRIHEDDFLAHRIMGNAQKILLLPDYFYYYLQREGSLSKGKFSIKKFDRIDALLDRTDFFTSLGKDRYAFYSHVDAIIRLAACWKYRKDFDSDGRFEKSRSAILARYKTTRYYWSELKYSVVRLLFRCCFPLLRVLVRITFGPEAF